MKSNDPLFETDDTSISVTQVVPVSALEAVERAQIDMQIATAKRYPRDVGNVRREIIAMATMDEDTAASCFYALDRGDKKIFGPSVRLAEIAFSCWGNIRVSTRISETVADGPMPHVVVQSIAHDLEKNTQVAIEKRRRITKKRSKAAPDEDDVQLATNSCSSIALRDALLRVVPKVVINAAYLAAKKVAVGDAKSFATKRQQIVDRLHQMGLKDDRILGAVKCSSVDAIDAEKLAFLVGLGTAIKDGEITIEEAFPTVATKPVFNAPHDTKISKPVVQAPVVAESTEEPVAAPAYTPEQVAAGAPVVPALVELEQILDENNIPFDALQQWAVKSGSFPQFSSYASLGDVPERTAARLVKAKGGLIKALTSDGL